jgi:CAAX prenyl protease-like protein
MADHGPSQPHETLTQSAPPGGLLAAYPWAVFVVPFAVFMLVGSLEPSAEKPFSLLGFTIDYSGYPLVYTAKIAATLVAIAAVFPGYRQFPFRVSPLALVVGVVGVVLWIGLCKLELEARLLGPLGYDQIADLGRRPGFNPLAEMADRPALAYAFLAVRLFGLALVVPLIEEFFIRGFVMRFVIDADWPKVPFGTLTPTAAAAGTQLPMLMHPAELFAAAVWFTLVTWLMFKTKNIWDCVAAHAVTNGLLGAYVLATGEWQFM